MTPFWLTAPSVGLVCTTTAKNHSHSTYCPVQQVGVRSRSWVHLDHLQTCTSPCEPCPSYWRYDPASSWFLSSSCREVRRPSPCRSETAASAASCDVTSPDWSDCCSEDLLYCESCPTTYHTQPQRTCYTVRTFHFNPSFSSTRTTNDLDTGWIPLHNETPFNRRSSRHTVWTTQLIRSTQTLLTTLRMLTGFVITVTEWARIHQCDPALRWIIPNKRLLSDGGGWMYITAVSSAAARHWRRVVL